MAGSQLQMANVSFRDIADVQGTWLYARFGHEAKFGERLLIGGAIGCHKAAVNQYPKKTPLQHWDWAMI